MRKLSLLLCFLVSALAASAQVLTDKTGVMVQPTGYFQGSCSEGRIGRSSDTGETYLCDNSVWRRKDLPACPASPPAGTCTGSATCIATISSAPFLYTCNAGTWAVLSGAGGSGSAPGGVSGQVQFNSNPTTLGGSSALTFNTGTGALSQLIVPTAPWALPADGGFYCDPNTECAYASGGTFYPLMGKWQYDANNDGTVDQALNVVNAPAFRQYQDYDTDRDGTIDLRIVGDYNGDGTLTLSDIQSALCTLQGMVVNATGHGASASDQSGCGGTPNSGHKTLYILPGVYIGDYRTELTVAASGITIMGGGMGATVIKLSATNGGACQDGSHPKARDNGDNVREVRNLFRVTGDDFELENLTVDANSQRWSYTHPKWVNAFDCNLDGTQDTNVSQQSCANDCTYDSYDTLQSVATNNINIHDCEFLNADGKLFQSDEGAGNCNPAKRNALRFVNNHVRGVGEHTLTAQYAELVVTGNTFENCGSTSCVHLYEGTRSASVTGNTFKEFENAAIHREIQGGTPCSPTASARFAITGNTIMATNTPTSTPKINGGGGIVWYSDADESLEDIAVTGNMVYLKNGNFMNGIVLANAVGPANSSRYAVSGNTVYISPYAGVNQPHSGIYVTAIGATVSGNVVDATGTSGGGATVGIDIEFSKRVQVGGNSVSMHGQTVNGLRIAGGENIGVTGLTTWDDVSVAASNDQHIVINQAAKGIMLSDILLRTAAVSGVFVDGLVISSDSRDIWVKGLTCWGTDSWCVQNNSPTGIHLSGIHKEWDTSRSGSPGGGTIRNLGSGRSVVTDYQCIGNDCGTNNGLHTSITDDMGFDQVTDSSGDGTQDNVGYLRLYARTHLLPSNVSIASAATITVDQGDVITPTGTTQINTINTCNSAAKGREITVMCGAALTPFGDMVGNINLSAAFTCASNKTLRLMCDGTNWQEIARSVN